jgi:predicted enzyme related to lactoylglutathione lyase
MYKLGIDAEFFGWLGNAAADLELDVPGRGRQRIEMRRIGSAASRPELVYRLRMVATMQIIKAIVAAFALLALLTPSIARGQTVGHVTGVGGIFVTSKDPKALAIWYRDILGIHIEQWGGAALHYDAAGHPPSVIWSAFPTDSDYLAPSTREFMIDFAVDDLDAMVDRLQKKGVSILKRDDSDPNGKFAWILDPDGTKIELWQPKAKH